MAVRHAPGEFCWADLGTTRLDAAKAFYSAVFGWKAKDTPMGPGAFYSLMRVGGKDAAAIYTLPPEMRKRKPFWLPYIWVKSVTATVRKARAAGATVTTPRMVVMEHGVTAILNDPAGAAFALWEPRAHRGAQAVGKAGTVTWHDLSVPKTKQNAARKFYESVFGWETEVQDYGGNKYYAFKLDGEDVGGMWPEPMPKTQPSWITHFKVADCRKTVAKAKKLGARVPLGPIEVPGMGRFAVIADPQKALFSIIGK